MIKIKNTLFLNLVLCSFSFVTEKKSESLNVKDFKVLMGNWKGQLTYLDYSSGKPFTMAANCEVKILKKENKIIIKSIYPDEMEANSVDTLQISNDGMYLNDEKLVSKRKNSTGELIIITENKGIDGNDNKSATFHHTYSISKNNFSIRKDVQFTGTTEWIKRHEYNYLKK